MYEDNEDKDEDGREESPEVEPPSGVTSRKAHAGVHIYIYVHSSPILINTMMMNHKGHSCNIDNAPSLVGKKLKTVICVFWMYI